MSGKKPHFVVTPGIHLGDSEGRDFGPRRQSCGGLYIGDYWLETQEEKSYPALISEARLSSMPGSNRR
jgi:hypothetical protein